MNRNIDTLIEAILTTVEEHKLAPGKYARWLIQSSQGNRDMGSSEYGCADAANILYSVGKFPRDLDERQACVAELRSFQKPDGRFEEPTHHTLHTTAHCIAALELFDAAPAYPLTYHKEHFGTPEQVISFLESRDWAGDPWDQSHQGAGFYAAMVLTEVMSLEWQDAYFDWLAEHADPVTGIGLAGAQNGQRNIFHHLAGWFHYMFNHVYAKRAFPYAEAMVDSCFDIYHNRQNIHRALGSSIGFSDIDWVFLINRASAQSGYRRAEVKELLREYAQGYLDWLENDLGNARKTRFDDLHALFGTVCALAELQLALPGEIVTTVPLKNVLDRRPFI